MSQIREPSTTGDDQPRPAIGVFQTTFSVSLNVIQSGKGAEPPPKAPTVAAPANAAGNADTCRTELDLCRRENWNVALRAMAAAKGSATGAALPPPAPGTPPPVNAPTAKTGPSEKAEILWTGNLVVDRPSSCGRSVEQALAAKMKFAVGQVVRNRIVCG